MKSLFSCIFLLALSAAVANANNPVTESRVWTETFAVDAAVPRLEISNIWGTVRVRPGDVGEIQITVDEHRSAPDQQRFERSLETLRLDIDADGSGVTALVGDQERRWQHRDYCRNCRVDYQFEVRVPVGTEVIVSTVMDGTVDVAGISGMVSASNVNGPVSVSELHNCEQVESVNGRVDISFDRAPVNNCDIETINGDVTLAMPNGSGLDVALDLFNGRLVTEFPVDPFALPPLVEHVTKDGRNRYRISQAAGVRLAGGGPTFSISSMNGDIRIQKSED